MTSDDSDGSGDPPSPAVVVGGGGDLGRSSGLTHFVDHSLVEDARDVMVSLVEPINAHAKFVSNLGRTWPIIDPSKKRGRLRRWQGSSAAVEEQPSKRQKVKKPSGIEGFDDVSFTDKTAVLPLPHVPGVSEETIQRMVRSGKYERCHQCQGCILGKGRPCLSLASIRRWDEGLGGVSPANAQDIADRVMRGERGVRCGMCRTCRQPRSNKLACVTALAAARGQLPPRLAEWISNDALSAQQELLHNLLKEYGGDGVDDDDGDDDNISCSEEDSEEEIEVQQCARDNYGEKVQNGEQWVCRSLIESNNSGSRFRSCGHLNTGAETVCSLCKCLRWELELESRVVAALNAGQGLEALLLYPMEELSSSLASRLVAEAGTFPEPLPGMAPERWGVDGERTLLEDVNDVLQLLRERYLCQREKESIDGVAFKKDNKVRLLRHSFLGKASKQVEYAVLRVVEEQSFLISEDKRLSYSMLPLHKGTALREPDASRSCPQKEDGKMTVYDVLAGELNGFGHDEFSEEEEEEAAPEEGGGRGGLSGGEEPGGQEQEQEQLIVSNFEMFCDEMGAYFGVDLLDESKADSNILNIVHNFCKRLFFACGLQFWTAERILRLKHAISQDSEVLDNLIAAATVANLGEGPPGLLSRTVEAVVNGLREGIQDTSNSPGTQNAEASQPHGPPLTQQSQMEGGVPPPRGVLRRNSLTADARAGQESNTPAPTLPIRFSTTKRVRNENVTIQDTSNVSAQSNRNIRIAMSLFHVLCSLQHAVLDAVALQEAESRCPKTLVHAQRRILYERSRFPPFSKYLTPSALVAMSEVGEDLEGPTPRAAVRTVPDSKFPLNVMLREVLMPRNSGQSGNLITAPTSAFSAVPPRHNAQSSETDRAREDSDELDQLLIRCPKDARMVFTAALKHGIRKDLITKCVRRFLTLLPNTDLK